MKITCEDIGEQFRSKEGRMEEILLEAAICVAAASLLMVVHELSKALAYMAIQRREGEFSSVV